MSLTAALDSAKSALSATSDQIAVVSRNVAGANAPFVSRKIASLESNGGGVRVVAITRTASANLLSTALNAASDQEKNSAISSAVTQLAATVGDPQNGTSPSALISKFSNALTAYAASPEDSSQAENTLSVASQLATGLRDASSAVQSVRENADRDMTTSVSNINSDLQKVADLNSKIVAGTQGGGDVSDALDSRDQVLNDLSMEIGIRTITRANNDIAIYTDGGVTLFDKTARTVNFNPTAAYTASHSGNSVYADGTAITGVSSFLASRSGRLVGLANVRDTIATTYQSQLDEMARGLISATAESDQSTSPTQPDATGLFTYPGAPAVPASGVTLKGLAADIQISKAADPAQGGDPTLIRDGGIASGGASPYSYNITHAAGFTDRLDQISQKLTGAQPFDPATQLPASTSLSALASQSAGWISGLQKSSSSASDNSATLKQKASDALSKVTGISFDTETSTLLVLEQSYQASARLISTINTVYQSLFSAIQ